MEPIRHIRHPRKFYQPHTQRNKQQQKPINAARDWQRNQKLTQFPQEHKNQDNHKLKQIFHGETLSRQYSTEKYNKIKE